MIWFVSASLVSLLLGLVLVNFFKPGVGVDISHIDSTAVSDIVDKSRDFLWPDLWSMWYPERN